MKQVVRHKNEMTGCRLDLASRSRRDCILFSLKLTLAAERKINSVAYRKDLLTVAMHVAYGKPY